MEFHHLPGLLNECLDGLNIRPDGAYLDCTLGGAGHSSRILQRLHGGCLYGIDRDADAIAAAALAALPAERKAGWRLFHYLSGGGIRAFAGSVAREAVSRRQTRFLWFMVGVGIVWLALRFI